MMTDKAKNLLNDSESSRLLTPEINTNVESTDEENKNRLRKIIIKMSALAVFTAIAIVFGALGWFTVNKYVDMSNAQVKTQGPPFSVVPVPSPYVIGIYDDPNETDTYVRGSLLSKVSKDPSVATWTITKDTSSTDAVSGTTNIIKGKNIGNGPAEDNNGGISPGSSGELQFKVIPSKAINAEFTFQIYSYSVNYDDNGDEIRSSVALIDDTSDSERVIAKNLLNGHILLFKDHDEDTNKYSGLVTSEDFQRIMTETYSTETIDSLYWVWPETLAELVLDDTNDNHKKNLRGKKSLCSDPSDILYLFKNHPEWFLLDPDYPNKTWTEFSSSTADSDVVAMLNNNYALYSAYYNEADQCIGTNVGYILLDMNANGVAVSNTDP